MTREVGVTVRWQDRGWWMASRLRLAPGGGEIKKSPPVRRNLRPLNSGRTAPGLLTLPHFFLQRNQCGAEGGWTIDDKIAWEELRMVH